MMLQEFIFVQHQRPNDLFDLKQIDDASYRLVRNRCILFKFACKKNF